LYFDGIATNEPADGIRHRLSGALLPSSRRSGHYSALRSVRLMRMRPVIW
jgi:hypothetical protein